MGRQWLVLGEKSKKSGARGKGSEDEDEGELAKHSCARLLQPLPTLGSCSPNKAERRSLSLQFGRIYVKFSTA